MAKPTNADLTDGGWHSLHALVTNANSHAITLEIGLADSRGGRLAQAVGPSIRIKDGRHIMTVTVPANSSRGLRWDIRPRNRLSMERAPLASGRPGYPELRSARSFAISLADFASENSIALHLGASEHSDNLPLSLCLNPFGGGGHVETSGKAGHSPDDRCKFSLDRSVPG